MKNLSNKLSVCLILLAVFAQVSIESQTAHAAEPSYIVRGIVIDYPAGQKPTAGVPVHIECQSHVSVATAVTDNTGHFSVAVPAAKCPLGADLMTTASFGGLTGGTRTHMMEDNDVYLQLGVEFNAPEYTWLLGAAATGAGIGVILLARRRCMP